MTTAIKIDWTKIAVPTKEQLDIRNYGPGSSAREGPIQTQAESEEIAKKMKPRTTSEVSSDQQQIQ